MFDIPMPMTEGRELPQFTLRQIDFPDVIKMEVKDTQYIVMKIEMIGKRSRADLQNSNDGSKVEGDFRVLSMRTLGEKPVDVKSLEQEHFEKTIAKIKSGKM